MPEYKEDRNKKSELELNKLDKDDETATKEDDNPKKIKESEFDFEKHAKYALKDYSQVKQRYLELSRKVLSILKEALNSKKIYHHSIQNRVKAEESFAKKAATPNPENPKQPKYNNPLSDIPDKAGVRIITYFTKAQIEIDRLINDEFEVIEKIDRTKQLCQTENFGYLSVHYLVKLKSPRISLIEYEDFKDMVCEIQVRTILQHAWAEIEHDIKYKSEIDIPTEIRRRFVGLAAILENADREFQYINDEYDKIKENITLKIGENKIKDIEITTTSVKLLLDNMYGLDARVSEGSYSWLTRLIIKLGIKNIDELKKILTPDSYGLLRRKFWYIKPSPVTIVEDLLLLHFKEEFIKKHPLGNLEWFVESKRHKVKRMTGDS